MFQRYLNWQSLFLTIAVIIAVVSLFYANNLTKQLEEEEQKRITTVAQALETLGDIENEEGQILSSQIISSNTTIPLIIADESGMILGENNHEDIDNEEDQDAFLKRKIKEYMALNEPIEVSLDLETKQYVYYGESSLKKKLRLFPYVLLGILFLFIILLLYYLTYSSRYLQDKVWVGMSKETAHQLGTPLTSLVAWIQHMREEKDFNPQILDEMDNDVGRLQLIADRFSKIGSTPKLEAQDIVPIIEGTMAYMQRRASKQVEFELEKNANEEILVEMNKPLLEWVLENLMRNALDAMGGKGYIKMSLFKEGNEIRLDVEDSGKGIPRKSWNKIFNPGYSTKKRGWGLGLSLAKRIMREYHKGNIFVHKSSPKGTTFRLVLNGK